MTTAPTSPIPVTGLVEVQNSIGDTLCVTTSGQQSWNVQVIRGTRLKRRSLGTILSLETPDVLVLKAAVDEFLEGNYRGFEETRAKDPLQRWIFVQLFGTVLFVLLGLTFLAFMISVFLKFKW
jgi:hypothetical protein